MSNEKALANVQGMNNEQINLVKRTICKGASDDELKLFIMQANRTGLDPFSRQIYSIRRKEYDKETSSYIEKMVTQVSIDGFRLVAERTGQYAGQLGPYWCGANGEWKEVWLDDAPPAAAKVAVIRKDFKEPLWSVATWSQYAQTYKDKNGAENYAPMWKKMPALMIAKCAESLALRKAFPQELSGLYTTEEMAQAETGYVEGEVKPAEKPAENVKPAKLTNGARGALEPEKLAEFISKRAGEYRTEGKKATEPQRKLVAMLFSERFMGNDDIRHAVQKYLTGVESLKDVDDANILSLLDWMKPWQDSGQAYHMDKTASAEAGRIVEIGAV